MFPVLHLLLLSFTLNLRHTSTAAADHVYTYCPNTTTTNTPSAFQSNLQTLLSTLSSAANHTTTGFDSATAGTATPYPLYGIFLCRGDVTPATCASCVANAIADLQSKCFRNQEAIIWYTVCMIKYSNASFHGSLGGTLRAFRKTRTVDGDLAAFDTVLGAVASKVKEEAATGGVEKKFATEEGRVNASLTVYVLGQCTPDLSATDCRQCLQKCIGILHTYCENGLGGLVLFDSCNLRYEAYQFYGGDLSSFLSDSPESEQLQIECGILLTTILLYVVFVLGCIRRRVHISWPGGCILVFHSLIIILIPLLLGLMRSADRTHKLFPIWACFLLFAYGGFDTMTARILSDNDAATKYDLSALPLFFWVGYVAAEASIIDFTSRSDIISVVAFTALYLLSVFNKRDTSGAFEAARKTHGLPKVSQQTEYHMRGRFINEHEATDDAVSMKGYPYLVDGKVTTTDIWKCVDELLPITSPIDDEEIRGHTQLNNPNMDNNESTRSRLKDICLSHAFFNILLMRCAGYSLERSRKKSMKFFKEGFLSDEGLVKLQERVFTIIEWELEFLFDFFYTKFYYLSTKRFPLRFKRLVGIAICLWFAIYELRRGTRGDVIGPNVIQVYRHSVEVGVTRIVILVIAGVEAAQLCMLIFSNWTIVKLICHYARDEDPSTTKKTFWVKATIRFISFVKYHLSGGIGEARLSSFMLKPWKRKLGQYSLLKSCDKVPMLNRLLPSSYAPRVSQKESHAVVLSSEVKEEIIALLVHHFKHGFKLSCGKASLERNSLTVLSSDFCNIEKEGDAYVILVWHIATSFCEVRFSTETLKCRVATQLSKYCAYLVIFAPELLSGVPYQTHTTVLNVINCAAKELKGTKDMSERWSKLVTLSQHNTLLGTATDLANRLETIFSNPDRGWWALAEFWVELILYLAPSENATAHAECLAKGGEFITLLWALLTHAGITSRAHFNTPTRV